MGYEIMYEETLKCGCVLNHKSHDTFYNDYIENKSTCTDCRIKNQNNILRERDLQNKKKNLRVNHIEYLNKLSSANRIPLVRLIKKYSDVNNVSETTARRHLLNDKLFVEILKIEKTVKGRYQCDSLRYEAIDFKFF